MTSIVHGYTTLADVKRRQNITRSTDDEVIKTLVTATSRMIDDYCQRRFYAATQTRLYSAPTAAYPFYNQMGMITYSATRPPRILIDDLLTITSMATDEDGDRVYELVWAATDYDLFPPNNPSDGLPYWEIRTAINGTHRFPFTPLGIQITGSWGYASTTPPLVAEACLAQVGMLLRAPDVALHESNPGIALEQIAGMGLHPWVRRMLNPFCKSVVG